MIDIIFDVILVELMFLLAILIIYWLMKTYSIFKGCNCDEKVCCSNKDKYSRLCKAIDDYNRSKED